MYDTLEGQVEVAKSRWSSSAMSSPLAGITPRSCWAVAKGLDTSIWAMSNKAMMFICSAYQKDVYEIMYKKTLCSKNCNILLSANDEMHSDATVVTGDLTASQL
jgi:hypothetical protein